MIKCVRVILDLSVVIVHDLVSFFSSQSLNPDECLTDIEITVIDTLEVSCEILKQKQNHIGNSLAIGNISQAFH